MNVRVLSVIHYPVFGGPYNRNARVASLLANDVDTTIVVPQEATSAVLRLRDLGLNVEPVELSRIRRTLNPLEHARLFVGFRDSVHALERSIARLRPDVIVINGSANPHAAIAARRHGVPIVWQLLDTFPPRVALTVGMPYICRRASVLMTNGMSVAAAHPGAIDFSGPLISFGPCIPVEQFRRSASSRAAAREELDLPLDAKVVGNVNNLNLMKGHDVFLRGAGRLLRALREDPRLHFVILGERGPDSHMRELERIASQEGVADRLRIRAAGPRVATLAQSFDVFWLTSRPRAEGMSNSLAEAQALEIPAVVMRSGAVHETLLDGESGFLISPGDLTNLVNRTLLLLEDEALARQFGATGSAFIRRNFSAVNAAKKHMEAYEAAIELGPKS
jgi:glycosyltransferase involved in cell wall biosynthesis